MDKQKRILRLGVLVLIVFVIAGIWFTKNLQTDSASDPSALENEDFVLVATGLDLETLGTYGLPIVVDFGADWCPPCRTFFPILKAAHEELLEKAIIKYVDTEKSPALAREYPISAIPTQLLINADGSPYKPSEEILNTGLSFKFYQAEENGEHILTVHEGGLTEAQFYAILEDMGVMR